MKGLTPGQLLDEHVLPDIAAEEWLVGMDMRTLRKETYWSMTGRS
jgi:hypothetical protein